MVRRPFLGIALLAGPLLAFVAPQRPSLGRRRTRDVQLEALPTPSYAARSGVFRVTQAFL